MRSLTAHLCDHPLKGLWKPVSVVSVIVALVHVLIATSVVHSFGGLQIQNLLFHPGLLDFHQRVNDGGEPTNLALWTPLFRGGMGRIDLKHGPTLTYAGGFLSALAAAPDAGELILAAQTVTRTGVEQWEAQGEYRLPPACCCLARWGLVAAMSLKITWAPICGLLSSRIAPH